MITPRFLDPLVLEEVDARRWRLTHELRYVSAVLRARLIIPVGFETDLSSIPRWPVLFWWLGGRGRKAGVVHDFVYRHHLAGPPDLSDAARRALADRVYPEALSVSEDVPGPMRWAMWAGLRLGGWVAWILLVGLLSGCASGALTHGMSGRFHVLLGPPNRVDEACRGMGVDVLDGRRVLGCYLRAGDAHFLWAAEDLGLADTLAHEWRHSHEGRWHP